MRSERRSPWFTALGLVCLVAAPFVAEGLNENPALTTEGPGIAVSMQGVGLSNLEVTGAETLSISIGGPVLKAAFYWIGGGADGQDDAMLINGNLVTPDATDIDTDPGIFHIVGYRADVTALVQAECAVPGVCNLEIADGDVLDNFYSNLVGAGLLVIYDDPGVSTQNRIVVFDGVDWAFSRVGVPQTAPVVLTYAAATIDRFADLTMFGADAQPDRADRVDISDNASLVNQLVANNGAFYDTLSTIVEIPQGTTQTEVVLVSPPEPPTADSLAWQTVALSLTEGRLGCRFTGGGVDTDGNWDHTLEDGSMVRNGAGNLPDGIDRYQFGGQAGAPTALTDPPTGEWTHHQQTGPSGRFTFHAGTASAPEGTVIDAIRCSDPGWCRQARPAPAKQLDFEGVGTFKSIGNGGNAPMWETASANVRAERNGANAGTETFHWFEVNVDDLGEPGSNNAGAPDPQICPSDGFGEKSTTALGNCDCPDYYRITIYDGVSADELATSGPNKTDVIYEVYGYVDGGNLQIHPLTGADQ